MTFMKKNKICTARTSFYGNLLDGGADEEHEEEDDEEDGSLLIHRISDCTDSLLPMKSN